MMDLSLEMGRPKWMAPRKSPYEIGLGVGVGGEGTRAGEGLVGKGQRLEKGLAREPARSGKHD